MLPPLPASCLQRARSVPPRRLKDKKPTNKKNPKTNQTKPPNRYFPPRRGEVPAGGRRGRQAAARDRACVPAGDLRDGGPPNRGGTDAPARAGRPSGWLKRLQGQQPARVFQRPCGGKGLGPVRRTPLGHRNSSCAPRSPWEERTRSRTAVQCSLFWCFLSRR